MNPRRFAENVKELDASKSVLHDLVDRTVENRCPTCSHLLGKGKLGPMTVWETKCPRCGMIVTLAVPRMEEV